MKKSLTINATRNGKKVSKNFGYVNPDVANSIAGGFGQMVNALTTDTYVNTDIVKKMDSTEEEQQSGGGTLHVDTTNCTLDEHADHPRAVDIENGKRIYMGLPLPEAPWYSYGYVDVTVV